MKMLLVDDENISLDILNDCVRQASPNSEIFCFRDAGEALKHAKNNHIDVAFLDIHLKDDLGTDLARKIQKISPRTNIIFVTYDDAFKAEALDIKVSGYISKPISSKKIKKELEELRYPVEENDILLRIQCFGNFAVFKPNGEIVKFSRSKSQEILAYLVAKRGTGVSTKELAAMLFEDEVYDEKCQHYLQQLLYALNKDLKAVGAEKILVRSYNSSSIDVNLVDCDYYRFCDNEKEAAKLYTGDFMMQYEWTDYVTGYLDRMTYESD